MGDSYFLTYGNDRVTFPGILGAVAWEYSSPPVVENIPGLIEPFAGAVAPIGYLFCDGAEVSRDTYATLFAVIGTTYGIGDGSTTFNLPDMSGRVLVGVSNDHALASTGGSETATLDSTTIPSHVHTVPKHGHANTIAAKTPVLSHTITQPVFKYNNAKTSNTSSGSSNSKCAGKTTSTATRSANVTIADHAATACTISGGVTNKVAFSSNSTGGSGAHNNLQPFTTLNYIICTGD